MTQSGVRSDGRQKMSFYLAPETIETLKIMAVKDKRHAYELVEDALKTYIAERHNEAPKKLD